MNTSTIVIIGGLVVALGVSVWWLVVAYKFRKSINMNSYTKGANLDPGQGKTSGTVTLSCGSDYNICVWRATAICTGESQTNHELSPCPPSGPCLDPISNGNDGVKYGDFSPKSTTDLTKELSSLANGSQKYTYFFNDKNQKTCPIGTRPQLISTYTCIPKGTQCKSFKI